MKAFSRLVLIGLSCFTVMPALSQTTSSSAYYAKENSQHLKKVVEYLKNLGGYLGYDITKKGSKPNQELLASSFLQLTQSYAFNTLLGATPVNAFSTAFSMLFPQEAESYQPLNAFANYTFASQPYANPDSQQGKVSVTPLIDQQSYQSDPVSQAVLNILSTPDKSYCISYDGTRWNKNCALLYQTKVMSNVLGPLPKADEYFSYKFNQQFIPQLNSNALIAPFLYSLSSPDETGAAGGGFGREEKRLSAQNQAQAAQNFIRYAANLVTPTPLPNQREYSRLYKQAKTADSEIDRKNAEAALVEYLTSLQVYAAQSSVALGNLYYILSKRMPQNQSADTTKNTSQALSEFTMATWRLYNPEGQANKQWINQLNQASPASVQKEMATLLAEINYQMYLSRQQNERLLLTNSILLLQNAKSMQPSINVFQGGQ